MELFVKCTLYIGNMLRNIFLTLHFTQGFSLLKNSTTIDLTQQLESVAYPYGPYKPRYCDMKHCFLLYSFQITDKNNYLAQKIFVMYTSNLIKNLQLNFYCKFSSYQSIALGIYVTRP